MTARLDGKIILVTGAASGIGAAAARMIGARGGMAVASDLAGCDLRLDVTSPEEWDAAIAEVVGRHGRLDGLVSNAGIAEVQSIVDLDLDHFRRVARVHVEGSFIGIQKVVAQMRLQAVTGTPATGSIAVTSSVMAQQVMPMTAAYATAKAALSNMARAIAVELGRKGDMIRVNAVAPGGTRTKMMEDAIAAAESDGPEALADVPLGDYMMPDDIAETVVFLLSDESSFMTGTTMTVDGGWSLT
jgi:3alpha(or 20beta)-hydroxysteroid dehydrogenase